MKREVLELIADQSANRLKELIIESADEIAEACHQAAEQAQEEESDSIKIKLAHTITLDLGKNRQTDGLAWSVRHKREVSGAIPDPDQPELSLEDDEQ